MVHLDRRFLVSSLVAAPLTGLAACGKTPAPPDILRVGLVGGPDSLDPLKAEFAAAALLFRQFFLPVIGYGPKGGPAAALATSWTPSNSNQTWTFEIASGLKWSDGKPITSKDVQDSLRLGADQKTAYADASELFMIKGYRDCVVDGKDPATIGVRAPDPTTLIIELNAPDAQFWSRMQEFYPIPLHARQAHGDNWTDVDKIVVSGPYKPTERTQTRLVFDHNPQGGWTADMPKKISVEAIEDASTRLRMYQSGDLDLAQDPPLLRAKDFSQEFGAQYQVFPAPRFIYMSLNTKKPQLQDPDIRRALAMGFDRSVIANAIMRGSVEPAGRFIRGLEQPAYDPNQAKALLAAKGYTPANPLRFELLVAKDDRERAAIQITDMWRQIGVEATLFAADSNAIVSRLNGFDFEAAIVRIDKGMKSDPIDLMASWGEGGTAYSHQWKDPAFDQALSDARAQSDPAARMTKTLAAEAILLQASPITGIWFFPSAWLVHKRISGGIEGLAPIIWPTLRISA
jgi:oligopeptide transport system substrate-binding protein